MTAPPVAVGEDQLVERLRKLLAVDLGDESDFCIDLAVATGELLAANASLSTEIAGLRLRVGEMEEALGDIASVDRPFVDVNGTDAAFMRIIDRARTVLHQGEGHEN